MGTRYMGTGHMGTWYRVHGTEYMGTGYMGTLEHDKWVGGNMVCEYMGTWLRVKFYVWVKKLGSEQILGLGDNLRWGRNFGLR